MDIKKIFLRAKKLSDVLPQYKQSDLDSLVTLTEQLQEQTERQAETILQQRIQLHQANERAKELRLALQAIGWPAID